MTFCNLCGGSKKIVLLLKQNKVVPYEQTYDCPECPKNHDIGEHKAPVSVPNGIFEDLHVQQTVDKFLIEDKRISKADIHRQLVQEIAHSQYFISKIRFLEETDHINMAKVFRATITIANPSEVKKNITAPTSNGVVGYSANLHSEVPTYKELRNIETMPMSQKDFDKGMDKLMTYAKYSKYMYNGT